MKLVNSGGGGGVRVVQSSEKEDELRMFACDGLMVIDGRTG